MRRFAAHGFEPTEGIFEAPPNRRVGPVGNDGLTIQHRELGAEDFNLARGDDADLHLGAAEMKDSHFDIVADAERLTSLSSEYEHRRLVHQGFRGRVVAVDLQNLFGAARKDINHNRGEQVTSRRLRLVGQNQDEQAERIPAHVGRAVETQ